MSRCVSCRLHLLWSAVNHTTPCQSLRRLTCQSSTTSIRLASSVVMQAKPIGKKLHSRIVDTLQTQCEQDSLRQVVSELNPGDKFGTKKRHRKRRRKPRQHVQVASHEVDDASEVTEEAKWEDVFGTLSPEDMKIEMAENESYPDDEGEVDESEKPYIRLSAEGRAHTVPWYGRQIEKLAKRGKVNEAIAMLETKMIKEDRVLPNQYVFTTLIGCLGRVGYTHKAFKLFNKMKKFGLQPEDPTYTALFNACSNSPWPEDGLTRAKNLAALMIEKWHQPNLTTRKASIKAYGVCGDLQGAFALVDDLLEAGYRLDAEVISSLLMACISDKQAGLKHAIEVWRQMRKKKIAPTLNQYNLLLRAVRDCAAGDQQFAQQLVRKITNDPSRTDTPSLASGEATLTTDLHPPDNQPLVNPILTVSPVSDDPIPLDPNTIVPPSPTTDSLPSDVSLSQTGSSVSTIHVPNILNPRGRFRNVVQIGDLSTPASRLALLGGVAGILSHMRRDDITPDIKTFTLLLDSLPSNTESEADLLADMMANGVKPDVGLLNMLIRRRNLRQDKAGTQEVVKLMTDLNLEPDMKTYGCLAMGCRKRQDGFKLLTDIQEAGYSVTVDIFTILIYQSYLDFVYKRKLCEEMKRLGVGPNERLLQLIENTVKNMKRAIVDHEHGKPTRINLNDTLRTNYKNFMLYYRQWLMVVQFEKEPHPWTEFRTPVADGENSDADISK